MDEDDTDAVMLINKFSVDPDEVDGFLKAFVATDKVLKMKPGYISAQLQLLKQNTDGGGGC